MIIEDGLLDLVELVAEIDAIRAERLPEPQTWEDGYIAGTGMFGYRAKRLCIALGQASMNLFDDAEVRPRAANEERLARTALVREICAGIDTAPLADRRMRNRIVHMDTHLGRMLRATPSASLICNLGFSRRDLVRPVEGAVLIFCRVYIFEEDVLLHLDTETPLGPLRESAVRCGTALHAALEPNYPLPETFRLEFMPPRKAPASHAL